MNIYRTDGTVLKKMTRKTLANADLRGHDFSKAHLAAADLRGADLRGANLRSADLRAANLVGADLRGSDLTGARLTGAWLTHTDLREATLTGALATLGITPDPTLPGRIVAQLTAHPASWDQSVWHDASDKHGIAGWACQLSGPLGRYLEKSVGTITAATLLLWHPDMEMPSFAAEATEDETVGRLRRMDAALTTGEDCNDYL